ncbi:phosphoribosyl-ATP pyrophosphohydrolase [Stackebrandtia endophytica]|uniref:Phosphoribosyl-ATP pyrophosphohydrolase n=1 Tax=Stackebrandtia endophytica TaxID=1496996 RepID=A0A543ASH9_9ACTN|nr:MazG-like family protein [Stackebrandtia endophytica]TQL75533.1 phosphoribosyl-ATP pyrophosphohydrolase [Stackebrandtia endophytica]
MTDTIWTTVDSFTDWLDRANGTDEHEITMRILKLTEEAGEAAAAWIGARGGNPRKGVTHTRDDVADELADVALSAMVAIASLRMDPDAVLTRRARVIAERMPDPADAPSRAACENRST